MRSRVAAALILGVGALLLLSVSADAVYSTYTLTGANPSWSGTMNLPAPGFPAATFTTDSNTPGIPSGATTYLGPGTPFGAFFGSSQNSPYLFIRNAAGGADSTTTFTFAAPTGAVDWGFALGDIDADAVTIAASGPGGPLTTDQLGWQSAFNYCDTTPTPPACTTPPFDDMPVWDPSTSTLRGNVGDTHGGAGWFRPNTPITTLTFTFTRQAGIPIMQLWFAALPITPVPPLPTVTTPDPTDPPTTTSTTSTTSTTTTTIPTTTSTTTAPSTTAPPTTAPPTTVPTTTRPKGPKLPATGASSDTQLPVGAGLVGLGAVLVYAARRLRRAVG